MIYIFAHLVYADPAYTQVKGVSWPKTILHCSTASPLCLFSGALNRVAARA